MAELRTNPSQNESPLLIFVTGLPSKSTVQVVLDHFKQYGKVQLYRINSPTNTNCNKVLQAHASANIKRGFCILRAFSESTYQNILSSSEMFLGRSLAIGPFRQGSELWSHNEHINSRRVIVKKVPASVLEDDLRKILETHFGTIHRMYKFAAESTHKAAKKEKSRKHNTYSIEFEHEAFAEEASVCESLLLPDFTTPVAIERFQKKTQLPGVTSIETSQSKNYNMHKSYEDGNPKPNKLLRNLFTADTTQLSPSSQNLRRTLGIVELEYHAQKPTAKKYHEVREIICKEGSHDETLNHRVRINVSKANQSLQVRQAQPILQKKAAPTFNLFFRAH